MELGLWLVCFIISVRQKCAIFMILNKKSTRKVLNLLMILVVMGGLEPPTSAL
jgi:hypothetical protein